MLKIIGWILMAPAIAAIAVLCFAMFVMLPLTFVIEGLTSDDVPLRVGAIIVLCEAVALGCFHLSDKLKNRKVPTANEESP